MTIHMAFSSFSSTETTNGKMVMDLPSQVILRPFLADSTQSDLQDPGPRHATPYSTRLWLLPASRWDTFLKQGE